MTRIVRAISDESENRIIKRTEAFALQTPPFFQGVNYTIKCNTLRKKKSSYKSVVK